jgi:4'-phosphopantetheinyl transferase EntD
LLPPGVALAVWEGEGMPELLPEEARSVRRAAASRRLEFARGRAVARRALAELEAPPGPIPVGANREPVWPPGFVGSITHCEGFVAAVAARSQELEGIGIDAEPLRPLPPDVRSSVLLASESSGCEPDEGWKGLVVYSAKESVHKALLPSGGVWMDFLDVEVRLEPSSGRFTARPAPGARAVDPRLPYVEGGFALAGGFVLATCHLAAREGGGRVRPVNPRTPTPLPRRPRPRSRTL